MKSNQQYPLTGLVEVDETFISGNEDGQQVRGNKTKDTIVIAIEKTKDQTAAKIAYAMKIENTSDGELNKIFQVHIDAKAKIIINNWQQLTGIVLQIIKN
jgi:hypothetical protein